MTPKIVVGWDIVHTKLALDYKTDFNVSFVIGNAYQFHFFSGVCLNQ
jgi:kynureninase